MGIWREGKRGIQVVIELGVCRMKKEKEIMNHGEVMGEKEEAHGRRCVCALLRARAYGLFQPVEFGLVDCERLTQLLF